MLLVKTKNGLTHEWHVNESFYVRGEDVLWIQADGHEWDDIVNDIKNIPLGNSFYAPVQRWYGDHAKFIADYLGQKWAPHKKKYNRWPFKQK